MPVNFKSQINVTNDWPRPGIVYYDVTPLFKNAAYFRETIEQLAAPYHNQKIDVVVGIEARGFVIASALALQLGAGLVLVRKKGKLPPPTVSQEYSFEYASHVIELPANAFDPGERIIVADDILATGGTMAAAVKLVKKFDVEIVGISFVAEMAHMAGRERLKGNQIYSLVMYE